MQAANAAFPSCPHERDPAAAAEEEEGRDEEHLLWQSRAANSSFKWTGRRQAVDGTYVRHAINNDCSTMIDILTKSKHILSCVCSFLGKSPGCPPARAAKSRNLEFEPPAGDEQIF